MLSGKNIRRVSLGRIRRAWVGIYKPTDKVEKWLECGHFIQGVQLTAEEIIETNGDEHAAERLETWQIAGSAQPSQNSVDDYEFYDTYLVGKQSFAFLCTEGYGRADQTYPQLWFFKTYNMGQGVIFDNRISLFPKHGYESPRQSELVRFDGLVRGFEIVKIDPKRNSIETLPVGPKGGDINKRFIESAGDGEISRLKFGNIRNYRPPPDGVVQIGGTGQHVKINGTTRLVPNQKISVRNAIEA